MKKFIVLVIVLCAVMVSSPVSATNWNSICKDVDGNEYFIDVSSISSNIKEDELYLSVLVRIVYSEFGRASMTTRRLPPELINFASYEMNRMLFKLKKDKVSVRYEGGAIYAYDGTILKTNPHTHSFIEVKEGNVYDSIFIAALAYIVSNSQGG